MLVERHADAVFFAPDDTAEHAQPIGGKYQGEMLGNASWPCYIECRPGERKVADHAIDRAAGERDRSSYQNPGSGGSPLLVHQSKVRLNPNELTKGFRVSHITVEDPEPRAHGTARALRRSERTNSF